MIGPFFAILAACAPEEEQDLPQLLGTIEARGSSAEVWDSATYFYASDSEMFLYMSAAEGVDCDSVALAIDGDIMESDGDGPALYQPSNACVLTVGSSIWDGSLTVDLEADGVTADAALSVNCWMAGEWVNGDDGWTFDGMYWNGHPTSYHLEVEGDEEGGTFTVEMSDYEGKDPLDFEGTDYPGTGEVSGTGDVKWCNDFKYTRLFD